MADAESGASGQERETALRRVNALMEKYSDSIMDISEDERHEDERGSEPIATGTVQWRAAVITIIGKLYGVFVYRTTGRDGRGFFVGRASSRVVVRYISEYLIRSIEAEAKTVIGNRACKNAFRLGAAAGAAKSVNAVIDERKRAAQGRRSDSSELALVDHYAAETRQNAALAHKLSGGGFANSSASFSDRSGFAAPVVLTGRLIDPMNSCKDRIRLRDLLQWPTPPDLAQPITQVVKFIVKRTGTRQLRRLVTPLGNQPQTHLCGAER